MERGICPTAVLCGI